MDFISKLVPTFLKKKALNYQISKDKYKILFNVFRNHKKISDGELLSHLQFVYNFIYSINIVRGILELADESSYAFILYKKGKN